MEVYPFRSHMATNVTACWDVRRTELNYAELRKLVGQLRRVQPYYYGDYYPLTPYSLGVTVSLALLGTVIGIVRAFHELGGSGARVSAGLMIEIGEALVATAIGLLVALPAVAFFNLFQRIIRIRIARADALGREVLAYLGAMPDRSMTPSSAPAEPLEA